MNDISPEVSIRGLGGVFHDTSAMMEHRRMAVTYKWISMRARSKARGPFGTLGAILRWLDCPVFGFVDPPGFKSKMDTAAGTQVDFSQQPR